jgi:hypothetical protein
MKVSASFPEIMKMYVNILFPYDFEINLITVKACPYKYLYRHIHTVTKLSVWCKNENSDVPHDDREQLVLRNNVTWMVLIPISDYSFAKCS